MTSKLRIQLVILFLAARLHGAEPLPQALVRGMSSENFPEREQAQAQLLDWCRKNPEASGSLAELYHSDQDPEVRKRSAVILKALAEDDYLSEGQGYLGILMQEEMLAPGADGKPRVGIRVLDIMPGTPAEKARPQGGDLIVALDGKGWEAVGAVTEFSETISEKKPLVEVRLGIIRANGEEIQLSVKLGKRPIPDLRAAGGHLQQLEEQARERHFREWLKRKQAE